MEEEASSEQPKHFTGLDLMPIMDSSKLRHKGDSYKQLLLSLAHCRSTKTVKCVQLIEQGLERKKTTRVAFREPCLCKAPQKRKLLRGLWWNGTMGVRAGRRSNFLPCKGVIWLPIRRRIMLPLEDRETRGRVSNILHMR